MNCNSTISTNERYDPNFSNGCISILFCNFINLKSNLNGGAISISLNSIFIFISYCSFFLCGVRNSLSGGGIYINCQLSQIYLKFLCGSYCSPAYFGQFLYCTSINKFIYLNFTSCNRCGYDFNAFSRPIQLSSTFCYFNSLNSSNNIIQQHSSGISIRLDVFSSLCEFGHFYNNTSNRSICFQVQNGFCKYINIIKCKQILNENSLIHSYYTFINFSNCLFFQNFNPLFTNNLKIFNLHNIYSDTQISFNNVKFLNSIKIINKFEKIFTFNEINTFNCMVGYFSISKKKFNPFNCISLFLLF